MLNGNTSQFWKARIATGLRQSYYKMMGLLSLLLALNTSLWLAPNIPFLKRHLFLRVKNIKPPTIRKRLGKRGSMTLKYLTLHIRVEKIISVNLNEQRLGLELDTRSEEQ